MKISREKLLWALEMTKPGVATKEVIEQSTKYIFWNGRVLTYNDEISVSAPLEDSTLEGAVEAKPLYDLVSRLEDENLSLSHDENSLRIKTSRINVKLPLQPVALPFPVLERFENPGEEKPVPENLMQALRFCAPCCSTNLGRIALTCVHVTKDFAEATDGFQAVRYRFAGTMPVEEFLIPAAAVRELSGYEITAIFENNDEEDTWIHFSAKAGVRFSVRKIDVQFPAVDKILTLDESIPIRFPADVIGAVNRAKIFASADGTGLDKLKVRLDSGKLTFLAEGEFGHFEETCEVDSEASASFATFLDPLRNALTNSSECQFAKNRISFSGENWQYVIAVTKDEE